jgi:outer membrane protein
VTIRYLGLTAVLLIGCCAWSQSLLPTQPVQVLSNADPGAQVLTLEQALVIAEKNNEAILVARAQLERARGRVQEARSAFLPTLNALGTYTHFYEESSMEFPSGTDQNGQSKFQSIVIQPLSTTTVAASAELPVDIGGVMAANRRAQQAGERISEQEIRRARQQLVLYVNNAYYNVARSSRLVDVAEEALRNSQQRLTTSQQQFAAGTVAQFDVIRAQTQVSQNKQNLQAAQNGLNLAKKAFNNILARPINTPVALYDITELPTLGQALDDLEKVAEINRPEIEQGRQNIILQEHLIQTAKRSVLPSLNLRSIMNYNPEPSRFGGSKTTTFVSTAILTFPLFDGGTAKARLRQQREEVTIARATLSQLTRGVSLEVTQAYLNLENARVRLDTAEVAVTEATESLRLSRIRYQSGVSIQLEVSDAELAFTQAETNLVNARYDYLTAWAQLQKAIGQDVAVN